MIFEERTIETAYLYLKNYTYHDNLNLFLRQRVAEFEIDNFDVSITELADILNEENTVEHPIFNKWISKISYHVLPKSISQAGSANKKEEQGLFLTNVRSAEKYTTEKINYFINAPIQLHIIEILWTLIVGSLLDKQLTKDCYGNRLSDYALNFHQKKSRGEVFKRYVEQYNQWRDKAIKTAREEAEKGENVALFSLDFQSFFYNIDIKFDDIRKEIKNDKRAELLTNLLEKIVVRYDETISSKLKISHPECEKKTGLPIGLASSSVLANWYLREFDKKVAYEIRPIYYGRYVDDILMVFKQPDLHDKSNEKTPFADFIETYLCLLKKEEKGESYFIKVDANKISVQKDKLILHYFDKEHSLAGLEVFKQELEERSSAFKFLPDDKHINSDLNKFAYDVLYDGSANKLRSVVGLSENETEFSRYLSSHITAHRLCKVDKKHQVLPQLKLFLRGTNVLKFHRLWEKVYQYMTVVQDEKALTKFYEDLNKEIDKLSFEKSSEINTKLKSDLKRFNDLAFALSLALKGSQHYKDTSNSSSKETFTYQFRESNLIRHHLVAWSLANFTDYDGDLTDETAFRQYTLKVELNDN